MSLTASVGSRARLTVAAAAVCALFVLPAAPAVAENDDSDNHQSAMQSCTSGKSNDGDASVGDGSASAGGVCQQRIVQHRDGDNDADSSVTRSPTVRSSSNDDSEDDDVSPTETGTTSDDLNCEDFGSQKDAQATLEDDSSDPDNLDADDDGDACEDFFTRVSHVRSEPGGGVETGGGGTLPARQSAAANVAKVAGFPLALMLIVGGVIGLRRGRLS